MKRSRTGLLFLSLMAVYVVVERREAFRPQPEGPSAVDIEVLGADGTTRTVAAPIRSPRPSRG